MNGHAKRRLLFVSPFPYGPAAHHGGAAAAYAQLSSLGAEYEVGVVCFVAQRSPDEDVRFLREHCTYFSTVPLVVNRLRVLAARAKSILLLEPVDALLQSSHAMTAAIHSAMATYKPDLVALQFPSMAQYIDACGSTPCIIDVQDAFSVSAFRASMSERTILRRWDRFLNWLFWIRYERRHYAKARAVLTLTEQDLWGLRAFQPELRGHVVGIPLRLYEAPVRCDASYALRLGFVGSFSHSPNREAIRIFITETFPKIRAMLPTVEFVIAGKNPPRELTMRAGRGVTFVGFVDSLQSFFEQCTVVVIPLKSGGGIKIKTLEALAAGAAVISTSIGAEGTGAIDGEHIVIRDDSDAFAAAVIAVLQDPRCARRLGDAAHKLMRKRFSTAAWRRRFRAVADCALKSNAAPVLIAEAPDPRGLRSISGHGSEPARSPSPGVCRQA